MCFVIKAHFILYEREVREMGRGALIKGIIKLGVIIRITWQVQKTDVDCLLSSLHIYKLSEKDNSHDICQDRGSLFFEISRHIILASQTV